jgi:hypothetical protein
MSTRSKLILALQAALAVAAGLLAFTVPVWVWASSLAFDFCLTPDISREDW